MGASMKRAALFCYAAHGPDAPIPRFAGTSPSGGR
jgi:hypothetical protein